MLVKQSGEEYNKHLSTHHKKLPPIIILLISLNEKGILDMCGMKLVFNIGIGICIFGSTSIGSIDIGSIGICSIDICSIDISSIIDISSVGTSSAVDGNHCLLLQLIKISEELTTRSIVLQAIEEKQHCTQNIDNQKESAEKQICPMSGIVTSHSEVSDEKGLLADILAIIKRDDLLKEIRMNQSEENHHSQLAPVSGVFSLPSENDKRSGEDDNADNEDD